MYKISRRAAVASLACFMAFAGPGRQDAQAAFTSAQGSILGPAAQTTLMALETNPITLYGCTKDLHIVGVTTSMDISFSAPQDQSSIESYLGAIRNSLQARWQAYTGRFPVTDFRHFDTMANSFAREAETDIALILQELPVINSSLHLQNFTLTRRPENKCRPHVS